MMTKKIADNPTYKDLREKSNFLSLAGKIYKVLKLLGYKNSELGQIFQQAAELKEQMIELSEEPDLFNSYYAPKGWIAYESMNSKLMEGCVSLAKDGRINEGEKNLIDYYVREELVYHFVGLKSINAFKIRYGLILKAYEDFKQERYHSSVPLLLILIDGIVNDVKKENKGFFAEDVDMTAWDSIAAHESGLGYVAKLFNAGRKRTIEEVIDMPYRNGILHGRDLGFDNVTVAAKLWNTFLAIGDWARIIIEGTEAIMENETNPSFKEIFLSHTQLRKYQKELEKWEPRSSEELSNNKMEEGTPEKELCSFFENVKNRKYGLIVPQMDFLFRKNKSVNKLAGEIREKFVHVEVLAYEIISIIDQAPALSRLKVLVKGKCSENKILEKMIEFIMIYEDDKGKPLVRSQQNGNWRTQERVLWNFYNFEWIE